MFKLIDILAWKWVDWRVEQRVNKKIAEGTSEEVEVKSMHLEGNKFEATLIHEGVAAMCEGVAKMLGEANCENYMEFDFFPRANRNIRKVRALFQWAHGLSPAQKNSKLSEIVKECPTCLAQAEEQRLIWHPKEEGDDEG